MQAVVGLRIGRANEGKSASNRPGRTLRVGGYGCKCCGLSSRRLLSGSIVAVKQMEGRAWCR